MAVVVVYDNGLLRAMGTDGAQWNQKVANEVMDHAIWTCPSGASGVLRHSHGVAQNRARGGFTCGFNVYNSARHALWVHNGTGIYGPRGTPIVPINTPKRKYLHLPSYMGFRWSLSYKLATPRPRRKGVRGPYVRTYDPSDPYGHAESEDGMQGFPWLRWAGEDVARAHGAY